LRNIAESVFRDVRFWHKYSLKSGNKRFGAGASVGADRFMRRNINQLGANAMVGAFRRMAASPNLSISQKGRLLMQVGTPLFGNCYDLSCLAAYLLKSRDSNLRVSMIGISSPGDHAFLVVGYVPGFMPVQTVMTLCRNIGNQQSYVVDIWAGIFCSTGEYPQQFALKADKWNAERKEIFNGSTQAWTLPDSEYYLGNIIAGQITITAV
jgi:hypothetical protein